MQNPIRITIDIDQAGLEHLNDQYLALYWNVAQANPAPYGDRAACTLVKKIGDEIIRRWLNSQGQTLYNHQAGDVPVMVASAQR